LTPLPTVYRALGRQGAATLRGGIVPGVTVLTSDRRARLGRAVGLAVLALLALFVSHDAIYVAQFGAGNGYAAAMSAGGHDGYYVPASLIVAVAAIVAASVALIRLGRLTIVAESTPRSSRLRVFVDIGPSYLGQLRTTWLRLFPAVVLLFALQENAEAFLSHGSAPGIDVVFGAQSGLVLPILAITTFLLAAVSAAIRWRTRVLLARVRGATRYERPRAVRPAPAWVALATTLAHAWMIDRRDAGRAPPITA
jgi:hypothetical protein